MDPEGRQEQVGRVQCLLYMDRFCSTLKFCVHKGPIFYNDIFSHQSEPHSKSSHRGRCSLSQPGSQETKSQPQFSLARRPPPEGHPASPPVTPCITVLAQSHARRSLAGSTGLTVPRQLREGSDFVLVRRTGKGRQQRVKAGFSTHSST